MLSESHCYLGPNGRPLGPTDYDNHRDDTLLPLTHHSNGGGTSHGVGAGSTNHNGVFVSDVPITNPGDHDVLLGRGGGTNNHAGNVNFRNLVNEHKLRYLAASKVDKPRVAKDVVQLWYELQPRGRFLARQDAEVVKPSYPRGNGAGAVKSSDTQWYEVCFRKAQEKASQCLRERTVEVLPYVQLLKDNQEALTAQGVSLVAQQLQQQVTAAGGEGGGFGASQWGLGKTKISRRSDNDQISPPGTRKDRAVFHNSNHDNLPAMPHHPSLFSSHHQQQQVAFRRNSMPVIQEGNHHHMAAVPSLGYDPPYPATTASYGYHHHPRAATDLLGTSLNRYSESHPSNFHHHHPQDAAISRRMSLPVSSMTSGAGSLSSGLSPQANAFRRALAAGIPLYPEEAAFLEASRHQHHEHGGSGVQAFPPSPPGGATHYTPSPVYGAPDVAHSQHGYAAAAPMSRLATQLPTPPFVTSSGLPPTTSVASHSPLLAQDDYIRLVELKEQNLLLQQQHVESLHQQHILRQMLSDAKTKADDEHEHHQSAVDETHKVKEECERRPSSNVRGVVHPPETASAPLTDPLPSWNRQQQPTPADASIAALSSFITPARTVDGGTSSGASIVITPSRIDDMVTPIKTSKKQKKRAHGGESHVSVAAITGHVAPADPIANVTAVIATTEALNTGAITMVEYQQQLEQYLHDNRGLGSNEDFRRGGGLDGTTDDDDDDDDEGQSDLEDDWEKERDKEAERSKTAPKCPLVSRGHRSPPRGVDRHMSGTSLFSVKSNMSGFSAMSTTSDFSALHSSDPSFLGLLPSAAASSTADDNDSKHSAADDLHSFLRTSMTTTTMGAFSDTRESKMQTSRSHGSNRSIMSELTDLSQNLSLIV